MKERLIEIIQDSVGGCARHWAEIIADALLAEGIVVPPCKVGDTIYFTHKVWRGWIEARESNTVIYSREVRAIFYTSNRGIRPWSVECYDGYVFDNCDFGKTVFLTKEEAEAELVKRSKTNA